MTISVIGNAALLAIVVLLGWWIFRLGADSGRSIGANVTEDGDVGPSMRTALQAAEAENAILKERLKQLDWVTDAQRHGWHTDQAKEWDRATAAEAKIGELETARPFDDYHEDMGNVLWWKFPVDECPWAGSPLASDWPGYHTHFTPLPAPPAPPAEVGSK